MVARRFVCLVFAVCSIYIYVRFLKDALLTKFSESRTETDKNFPLFLNRKLSTGINTMNPSLGDIANNMYKHYNPKRSSGTRTLNSSITDNIFKDIAYHNPEITTGIGTFIPSPRYYLKGMEKGAENNQYSMLSEPYMSMLHNELENNIVPNTVYFTWCERYTIPFSVYLSIISVWKKLKPDLIYLLTLYDDLQHYNYTNDDTAYSPWLIELSKALPGVSPESDYNVYNLWLSELESIIPGFKVIKIPDVQQLKVGGCGIRLALQSLTDTGGIYFSVNTFLISNLVACRKKDFTLAMNKRKQEISFLFTQKNSTKFLQFKRLYLMQDVTNRDIRIPVDYFCEPLNVLLNDTLAKNICVTLPKLNPKDIIELHTDFGTLSRSVMYGEDDNTITTPLLDFIPKVVHMVWYGKNYLTFQQYLSIRSILTIMKPFRLYIHGDIVLRGHYMKNISRDPRVIFVNRDFPKYIFGKEVKYPAAASDIIRADVLLKYGGIYIDWDVLWIKPVDDLILKGHDAVVTFDHLPWSNYPDTINLGVLMAKPGSHFIKNWQNSLKNFRSDSWFFNAIFLPYKIYEKFPNTVKIEPHLQVMCYNSKCHPTYRDNFKNVSLDSKFNWKSDGAYSVHLTMPDPFPEFASESVLEKSSGTFADIGKYILHQNYKYDN